MYREIFGEMQCVRRDCQSRGGADFEIADYFIQQAVGCGLPAMDEIAGDVQNCGVAETGVDIDNSRGEALRRIDTVK